MIDILIKRIKTNIAQQTPLFNVETVDDVRASLKSNIITVPGLHGEYTLSGSTGTDTSSAGCINDTFIFNDGVATTDCFLGESETFQEGLTANQVNVGSAFKRDVALEIIVDTKLGNSIVVYIGTVTNTQTKLQNTVSEDLALKVAYRVGILFKVKLKEIDAVGCVYYDSLFINSVVGAEKDGATMLEFREVTDRFYASEFYVAEMQFEFTNHLFSDASFLSSIKNFDYSIGKLRTL